MGSIKDITENIYRRRPGIDLSSLKTDIKIFNIIMAMDGIRSVATIAREDAYEIEDLVEQVNELVGMGLLESVHGDHSGNVDSSFINALRTELTDKVGPVAGKLIDKKISELGYNASSFPVVRVGELLDILSTIFPGRSQRVDFKLRMKDKLND